MANRRSFIKKASFIGLASQFDPSCFSLPNVGSTQETDKWTKVANQFFSNPSGILNFNTGSAGIMPKPIYDAFINNTKALIEYAPYEVKSQHDQQILTAIEGVAQLINAPLEGLALVRNTTEGIASILNSYPFEEGDEVIISKTAYPYPHYLLDRLEKRKGIKKVEIDFSPAEISDEEILAKYSAVISSKTRLIVATHVLHREGQIMPVKAICSMARNHGVEVLLDAAHSIGQIEHDVLDIGCDYYISSLHKWLYAPLGSGLLYMKKEHIPKIDTGFSYPLNLNKKIKKYDYTGTIAFQNAMTLPAVLQFNNALGPKAKQNRLAYLANYLRDGLSNISGLKFLGDSARSLAMVSFSMESGRYDPILKSYLDDFKIHVKKSVSKGVGFVRATVNLHMLEEQLDYFITATEKIARQQ